MSCRRPEHSGPAYLYYNDEEAKKYTTNSRMIGIQAEMSERAIELLSLPVDEPCLLLDVGCGSGLSGDTITDLGHEWIGVDISQSMLNVAVDREVDGDIMLGDAGEGVCFRPGTFDGVISISALQWLCNADSKSQNPIQRLNKFFTSLYAAMRHGSRGVFQVYPENPQQLELITTQAIRAGFTGGVVIDYPNSTKAKKIFLCIFCGVSPSSMPKALGTDEERKQNQIEYSKRQGGRMMRREKLVKKSVAWIQQKKQRRIRQGKTARADTKYTGRKRRPTF